MSTLKLLGSHLGQDSGDIQFFSASENTCNNSNVVFSLLNSYFSFFILYKSQSIFCSTVEFSKGTLLCFCRRHKSIAFRHCLLFSHWSYHTSLWCTCLLFIYQALVQLFSLILLSKTLFAFWSYRIFRGKASVILFGIHRLSAFSSPTKS